jgi:hypothetical protein
MVRLCTDDQMRWSRRTVEVGVGAVAKQAGCLVNTMWLSHSYEQVIPARFR